MNVYDVKIVVVSKGKRYTFQKLVKGTMYSGVAARSLRYMEKIGKEYMAESTQIAMRIKRKLT